MGNNFNIFFGHWNIQGPTIEKLERIKQTNYFDVWGIVETRKFVNIERYEKIKASRKKVETLELTGAYPCSRKEERLLQLKGYLVNRKTLCGLCFV